MVVALALLLACSPYEDSGPGKPDPLHDPDGDGYTEDDCAKRDAAIHPGAVEACDGVDNNCDGAIDDGDAVAWFVDLDGDGFGDAGTRSDSCASPGAGWVMDRTDCDDASAQRWTDAEELCDGVDNDCDGIVDEDAVDTVEFPADEDGDGFGDPVRTRFACTGADNTLDCDDGDAAEPVVVDLSSSASAWDGTAAFPFLTVQEGIDAAATCVLVYPGEYVETVDFSGRDVLVESVAGRDSTTLDGGGLGSVVTFASGETNAAELRGFTIRGGIGTYSEDTTIGECGSAEVCAVLTRRWMGGNIYIDGAAPTLSDVVVRDGMLPGYYVLVVDTTHEEYTYSYGGGVFIANTAAIGTVLLEGLDVLVNEADRGGGIYVGADASLELSGSRLAFNSAVRAGGGVAVSGATAALTMTNTALVGNLADEGGGVVLEDGRA